MVIYQRQLWEIILVLWRYFTYIFRVVGFFTQFFFDQTPNIKSSEFNLQDAATGEKIPQMHIEGEEKKSPTNACLHL